MGGEGRENIVKGEPIYQILPPIQGKKWRKWFDTFKKVSCVHPSASSVGGSVLTIVIFNFSLRQKAEKHLSFPPKNVCLLYFRNFIYIQKRAACCAFYFFI